MRPRIWLEPGMKLVATVLFVTEAPLFVTIMGPAGVSFGSTWPRETKEITNESDSAWQLSVQASHGGPIGSEVPVRVLHQSESLTLIAVGSAEAPEALLVCAVLPRD